MPELTPDLWARIADNSPEPYMSNVCACRGMSLSGGAEED
jgi:hypothetical protein